MSPGAGRRALAGLASVVLLAGVAPTGAPAAAQEPAPPDTVGGQGGEGLPEPAMPEAPDVFRISLAGGALMWGSEPGRAALDDGGVRGLDIESRVGRFLAFRLSGAYGRSAAVAAVTPEPDTLPTVTDLNQVLVDLVAELRLGLRGLEEVGVVPFGTLGVATVVHDPAAPALITKSQSAWAYGLGVEVAGLAGPLGARAEWRRYQVEAENLFAPADRTGSSREADRLFGTLYLEL